MDQQYRNFFDRQVELVLRRLPPRIRRLMREVPLHVDDRPPKEEQLKAGSDIICGQFCGVPFTDRSIADTAVQAPSYVIIFREGISTLSRAIARAKSPEKPEMYFRGALLAQIRITILHEYAHLHGIGERELEKLGYG